MANWSEGPPLSYGLPNRAEVLGWENKDTHMYEVIEM